ncbi:Transcriptional regulatory protein ros [Methylobacterium crusticola]|uniref:Transcriptional regulatory protein ros n=1 Tax=Methylobacterium crusticola TaxID=1697972 RepID=A0ABQ4QVZ6_9HYPH|nr:MucR family transcriptional regulator [Methylobacterium crusticola]GJD49523.1 Transcriptional regulatory protein ros [Methylobacterium crusticola]
MPDASKTSPTYLVELSTEIVATYVAHNSLPASEVPSFLIRVHEAFTSISKTPEPEAPVLTPAVSIKKTITPDRIISLEDGKGYKTLKRHLGKLGLTPATYRQKWGLPHDYPMVAANYAAERSALARASGLGTHRAAAKAATKDDTVSEPKPRG